MKFRKMVAGAVMVQTLVLLGPSAANANVILTYTGNDFNSFSPPGQSTYTTSDNVTAMITLANPLAINTPNQIVTPIEFSISDGVQTFTQASSLADAFFDFTTNSADQITMWDVLALATNFINTIETRDEAGSSPPVVDLAAIGTGITNVVEAEVLDDQGVWESVPEPPTVTVLGLGLLGLGLLWWRRRQKRGLAQ